MNLNPYKRPDYKNQTDAELEENRKQLEKKKLISMGINLTGALICAYVVLAAVMPAVLPAIPVFYGTTLIALGICSTNRFEKLGSECRAEKREREQVLLNQMMGSQLYPPAPQAAPASAPAPAFNHVAATVLDDDLEINRPLQFRKKAPGAAA